MMPTGDRREVKLYHHRTRRKPKLYNIMLTAHIFAAIFHVKLDIMSEALRATLVPHWN